MIEGEKWAAERERHWQESFFPGRRATALPPFFWRKFCSRKISQPGKRPHDPHAYNLSLLHRLSETPGWLLRCFVLYCGDSKVQGEGLPLLVIERKRKRGRVMECREADTAVSREAWTMLPESSSWPLMATLAKSRNLAHASLKTAVAKSGPPLAKFIFDS